MTATFCLRFGGKIGSQNLAATVSFECGFAKCTRTKQSAPLLTRKGNWKGGPRADQVREVEHAFRGCPDELIVLLAPPPASLSIILLLLRKPNE